MKYGIEGLSDAEVLESRAKSGRNVIETNERGFLHQILDLLKDPMLILLLAAATLYLISGQTGDAIFMAAAIFFVSGISLYQESRSRKALSALKNIAHPFSKVIRNGDLVEIPREDIVVGDYVLIEEGNLVPADGTIIHSNDFSINEATLTGESFPVPKSKEEHHNKVFDGTTVVSGLGILVVDEIGKNSALGKIGKRLESLSEEKTPLEKQVRSFVKKMALVGLVVFIIVWGIHFFNSNELADSLLKALTLAMSVLPEEIPVAFTAFMALGAWRLMKLGIIVRQTKTVEALGSATVICTDKTGTITENRMSLANTFNLADNTISDYDPSGKRHGDLITLAMWASEPIPFDPMEIALHQAYSVLTDNDLRREFSMVHEYPLGGTPPMMTHVLQGKSGEIIIAAKGAPEAIINASALTVAERNTVLEALDRLGSKGYRVLGVAEGRNKHAGYPQMQHELHFTMKGLVAFYDPPKKNIRQVFKAFYDAGIDVKIITGDNATTTLNVARQIDLRGADITLDGKQLVDLSDEELRKKVKEVNIFTRMFPEAKLKILNALKANGQIVAMTGDGVNDGPALKAAHIGIAMGKRGSEVAKEVSSLILTDDDLARMVDAIAMGRRIYENLKKAIQYIISIHIPIILTVFLPLALRWKYPAIFTPVHIIFLELIMGPTCSIIYENEPMEKDIMLRKPRPFTTTFFNIQELATSIMQGLVITFGVLIVYQFAINQGYSESLTRTMTFVTLITANIFLTLNNRSFHLPVIYTLRYKNRLVPFIIGVTVLLTAAILLTPTLRSFFGFEPMTGYQTTVTFIAGFISVMWFELVKWLKLAYRS